MLENFTLESLANSIKGAMLSALRAFDLEKKPNVRNWQNKYSLQSVYCTPYPRQGVTIDGVLQPSEKPLNGLYLQVSKPFILIDTVVVNNTEGQVDEKFWKWLDRDSNKLSGVRFNNHLCYMRVTPGASIAQWADVNTFLSTAGTHVVPDYRDDPTDDTMKDEVQIAFVLVLNDNYGENGF